ncbi:MAG TPA: RIP metalloprotease RseP [Candidatus Angelobacter sp.]|jgi:regulator of sigma E protease|nr:RIP metalloprotease RseP [Candidatus Angelobacter sp.]
MSFLIYVASFILILGILVFVHEFGHYAVAKLCGVRVEVFSLGFGKRILGFKRGDTDYRISILPLGGYVKMAGENPLDSRTGDPGEFTSHPRWQRFLIAIAGPVMNILLAIVVLTGVFMVHHYYFAFERKPAQIAWVRTGSAAETAGVQPGDTIVNIKTYGLLSTSTIANPTWDDLLRKVAINSGRKVDLLLQRGDKLLPATIYPKAEGPDEIGQAGLTWEQPVQVAVLEPGSPADKAGIQLKDTILALNKRPIKNMGELADRLQEAKGAPVEVAVQRGQSQMSFQVTPIFLKPDDGEQKRYVIGIRGGLDREDEKLPFKAAFTAAVDDCRSNSLLIFELVGKMIQRHSMKQISGPIGIAKVSGEALKAGLIPMFSVMALISINLAIFNLFPIPILDGGLMLMLLIESIMRRDIKQQVKERVYQVAFVFLVLFAAMVIYNDITKTWPGHPL